MTTTRRILTLVALVTAAVLGTGAAQASYADSASAPTTTIATATIAAPTAGPGSLACGRSTATMGLTWTPSTSPRVTGYRIAVYFSDGYVQTVEKAATDTSWSQGITLYNVTAYSVRYSVSAVTDYGWTAESATTVWFRC